MNGTLNYFVGKVCTVSTTQINFRFKEEQMMDYFMGVVESIDENGLIMTHPQTGCKTYVAMPHVVSIAEEQVLFENNPEDKKIIEEYREAKPNANQKFIDPQRLAEISKQARERFSS